MVEGPDVRKWVRTDLPGEWIAVGQPVSGIEVLSARGSTRHWSEPLHETFTVAAVKASLPSTATEWRTRGRTLTTAGGQLMNINAGDGHSTLRVHAPAQFDVIKLTPSWIEDSARDLEARQGFSFRSSACENANVFRMIQRLVRAIAMDEPPFVLESACHEVAHAVVTELAEAGPRWPRRSGAARDFRLRRVREYLVEHPDSRPSLDVLERDAGLGKTQLCALFKKEYGVSIGQYWSGCRVAKASAALLQGILAKDVAAELGFSDEAHLSRVFKRHRGLPPRAWASLYRSNTGGHGKGHVSQGRATAAERRGSRSL